VKVALNTLVNAETRSAAIKSVAREIGGSSGYKEAKRLICQIEANHQPIAPFFGTGAGLRLMRRDSDMAEQIELRLLAQGVIALPLHDSFIIPQSTRDKAERNARKPDQGPVLRDQRERAATHPQRFWRSLAR
jgi:hypothetical protein